MCGSSGARMEWKEACDPHLTDEETRFVGELMRFASLAKEFFRRRPGRTVRDWAEQRMPDAALGSLSRAGLWPTIEYSAKYSDDAHEYRHVTLPVWRGRTFDQSRLLTEHEWRSVGVGFSCVGWSHYMWHRPEPHVLLFRRPRQDGGAVAGARPEDGWELVPAAPARWRRDPPGQAPGGGEAPPAPARWRRDPPGQAPGGGEAPPAPARWRQDPLGEGPNAPVQCVRGRLWAGARGLKRRRPGLGHAGASEKRARPDDETLAALGLSVKLSEGTEVTEAHKVYEAVLAKMGSATESQQVRGLSRVIVLVRGVRGRMGVPWLGTVLQEARVRQDLLSGDHVAFFQRVSQQLLKEHTRESRKQGHPKRNWAGHLEGRHKLMSGRVFLDALATRAGWQGAAESAVCLETPVRYVLRAQGEAMPSLVLEQLLTALLGRLVLCIIRGKPQRAGQYTSMDGGRAVWMWAVRSGRCQSAPLTPRVFRWVLGAQSRRCRKQLRQAGVTSADALELKRVALEKARGGGRPVLWPSVFVHMCEWGQAVCDPRLGGARVKQVLLAPQSAYRAAVEEKMAELAAGASGTQDCHTVQVLLAALTSLTTVAVLPAEPLRQTASPLPLPATEEPQRKVDSKGSVLCPRCGALVRRDVLARHQKTIKCMKIRLGDHPAPAPSKPWLKTFRAARESNCRYHHHRPLVPCCLSPCVRLSRSLSLCPDDWAGAPVSAQARQR